MAYDSLCFIVPSAISCEFLFRCNFLVATVGYIVKNRPWFWSKKDENLQITKAYRKLLARTESGLEKSQLGWNVKKKKWRLLYFEEVYLLRSNFRFKNRYFHSAFDKTKERSSLVGFTCNKRCWKRAKTTHWHVSKKSILILPKNSWLCFHEQEM